MTGCEVSGVPAIPCLPEGPGVGDTADWMGWGDPGLPCGAGVPTGQWEGNKLTPERSHSECHEVRARLPRRQRGSMDPGAERGMFLTPRGFCVSRTWCAPRALLRPRPRRCSPAGGSRSACAGTRAAAAGAPRPRSPRGRPESARRPHREHCNTKQGGQAV